MVPRVSRRLCLFAAFMVALTLTVHVTIHGFPSRAESEGLRLYQILLSYLIAVWLVSDPKLSEARRPSFDHAYMHMIFFPFLACYEQVVTRRWKGAAITFGLFVMYFVPTVLTTGF